MLKDRVRQFVLSGCNLEHLAAASDDTNLHILLKTSAMVANHNNSSDSV